VTVLAAALFAATAVSGARAPSRPTLGGCQVFPASNAWNRDVSRDPVDPRSAAYIRSIDWHSNHFVHADFGGRGAYGIPYRIVPRSQRRVPIRFTAYGDESDPAPYPIPLDAPVERSSDRHVLVLQTGAVFDLRSNRVRPDGWTSADAAGLPILPGLARYGEARAGAIRHALRFTVSESQRTYIHPATHFASDSSDRSLPPMGLRLRLKRSYPLGHYRGQARTIRWRSSATG
jgi:hypothetical protein